MNSYSFEESPGLSLSFLRSDGTQKYVFDICVDGFYPACSVWRIRTWTETYYIKCVGSTYHTKWKEVANPESF